MRKGKGCISLDAYMLGVSLEIRKAVREERLRIAGVLYERIDLPVSEIARIVNLKESEVKESIQKVQRKIKYHATAKDSDLDRMNKTLTRLKEERNEGLPDKGRRKKHNPNSRGKERD